MENPELNANPSSFPDPDPDPDESDADADADDILGNGRAVLLTACCALLVCSCVTYGGEIYAIT